MTIRSACLLAAAALAVTAAPALAQDDRYDPGPPPPLPEEGTWEDWDDYPVDGAYDESWEEREYRSDAHDARPGEWRGHPMPAHGPGYATVYPPDVRAQWLEDCRARYRDDRGRESGQVIGGVLGAIAGGVVGSEIADGDDNLGGTLIGAGVGGLAGAVVGGEIGAAADRGRIDECEAYLLHYEQSYRADRPDYGYDYGPDYGQGPGAVGYHYPYPYPVMWVKVPIHTVRRGDCGCETVIEERVVEEAPPPPPRRARRVIRDKRIRITK